ncbi:hypothetical protein ABE10_25440, partial [Bacillus toyonensis]|nr:hypothetical protein [Bacillus toyonensis]
MDEVAHAVDLEEPGSGEEGNQVPLRLDRGDVVALGGDEERGHVDPRRVLADIVGHARHER